MTFANPLNDQTTADDAGVKATLVTTLITTAVALMLVISLFITSFASIEASASPVRSGLDAGDMVSVGYLA